jgi:hypothetical protein
MRSKNVSKFWWRAALAGALALSATAAVLALVSAGGGAQEAEREKAVRGLGRLRDKYAAVNTVHLSAGVKVVLHGKELRAGNGAYEFWAQGDRYRVRSRTDKQLGLKTDFDVAYDGARFYMLDHSLGVLSYRRKDEPRSVTALPNPLFLPVDFLSGDDDDCPLCALRLPDLKAEDPRWGSRSAALAVRSRGRDAATGAAVTEVEMPGGRFKGRPFKMRVRMTEQGDGGALPTQIDRVADDGKLMVSITLGDFAASGLGQFPRSIVVKAYGDDGNIALQAELTVKVLEVNAPIEPGVFAISFDEAEAVWDSDGKKFVKEKTAAAKRPQG